MTKEMKTDIKTIAKYIQWLNEYLSKYHWLTAMIKSFAFYDIECNVTDTPKDIADKTLMVTIDAYEDLHAAMPQNQIEEETKMFAALAEDINVLSIAYKLFNV